MNQTPPPAATPTSEQIAAAVKNLQVAHAAEVAALRDQLKIHDDLGAHRVAAATEELREKLANAHDDHRRERSDANGHVANLELRATRAEARAQEVQAALDEARRALAQARAPAPQAGLTDDELSAMKSLIAERAAAKAAAEKAKAASAPLVTEVPAAPTVT